MFEVVRYTAGHEEEWNRFVMEKSKNGTFLLNRRYMDYHKDRFHDHSLMFFRDGRLLAVLPANEAEHTLFSHQGLTYGGLLLSFDATAADVLRLLAEMNDYLRSVHIRRVVYKAIPWIYQQLPSEEDLYALTQVCKAQLTVREISTTIVLPRKIRWARLRRRGVARAVDAGVKVERSNDYQAFWEVLDQNLMRCHHVHPVHSSAEMELLSNRFPDNIILYTAVKDGNVLGGVVMYVTPQVVHAQYSSATEEGKRLGVLDAIYDRIMHEDMKDYPYFDFGKSTEDSGHILNEQLIFQKEGFGGRAVCYDTYEWEL
ncbi:MAG: GNAT family N-acetyltransferase [Prevotella sp.]|nr:GNAT family N-acetyltransferase [Prevotella sp.]